MPVVEVDENELVYLRRIGGVASKIMSNPEGKKLLERAHKLVDPNAATPALDQEHMIREPVNAALKRVEQLEAELKAERDEREKAEKLNGLQRTIDEGFAKLRGDGWQEDGIKKVDEFMKERGIVDPLIAAAYVEKTMPPSQPATPSGGTSWNFIESVQDGEADLKKLIESKGNYEPLVDKMAREALGDVRGQTRR